MTKIKPFDAAKHFETPEAQERLLVDARATEHPTYIEKARLVVEQARRPSEQ
jgi:DNA-binding phage protein